MKRSLNIAALSRTTYWHGMQGGMDVHGKLLAKELADRGHRIVFISTRHPAGKTFDMDDGVELYYLPDTIFGSRRHGWAAKSVRILEEMHLERPFDLVWSQSFDGFGLAKAISPATKLPLLATLHGCIAQELTSYIENIRRSGFHPGFFCSGLAGLVYSYFISQKPLLRRADRIVTVSGKAEDDLRKWFGTVAEGKCVTIYNGVDTTVFYPDEEARNLIRRRFNLTPDNTLLLSLGRLTREKGHHLLIEALSFLREKHPLMKLMIVGEGESLPALHAITRKLALEKQVIFTGPVENHETASYYNAADLFLFPTLTVEGLPFVLIEAMACGKPVIASDRGGNREVIQNGENGILIPHGSCRRIAAEIEALAVDHARTDRLSKGALATIRERFSLLRMIDRMEEEMAAVAAIHSS